MQKRSSSPGSSPSETKSVRRPKAGQVERTVKAGADASKSLTQAATRVGDALETLKRFAALDEAERKPFDIRQGIDETLSLMRPRIGGRVRVVRPIRRRIALVIWSPTKLNRVFLSLLENAAEAFDDDDPRTRFRFASPRREKVSPSTAQESRIEFMEGTTA